MEQEGSTMLEKTFQDVGISQLVTGYTNGIKWEMGKVCTFVCLSLCMSIIKVSSNVQVQL